MSTTKKKQGMRRKVLVLLLLIAAAAVVFGIIQYQKRAASETPAAEVSQLAAGEASESQVVAAMAETMPETEPATEAVTTLTLPAEPAELPVRSCQLDAQPILQNPELPTGCEITSLTMALNYLGYDVDKLTMADDYLIRGEAYQNTFDEAFIGSPYDPTSWGCYAPVIVQTAQNYLADQGGGEVVQDLTGCSLKTLLGQVAGGTPVVTWATINMTPNVEEQYYWTTPDGDDAVFLVNEHCLLLCGYDLDANTVTVCDPLEGKIDYDMDVFENRFELIHRQAVAIYPQ